MKIISLNTFSAGIFDPFMDFVDEHKGDTDIFCFQEILDEVAPYTPLAGDLKRPDQLRELKLRLADYQVFFSPAEENFEIPPQDKIYTQFGLAMFVHKKHRVREFWDFFICNEYNSLKPGDYTTMGHNAQCAVIEAHNKSLTVCNLHGTSQPGSKLDTPVRISQSQRVLDELASRPGEKIIMGDFNLFPQTQSIQMFVDAGYRNLITEFAIKTTRGTLVKKMNPHYAHTAEGFQEYADFTFVTSGITVQDLQVPDLPISDHLPMIMTFEV